MDLEGDYRLEDLLLNLDPQDPGRAVSRPSSTRAVAMLLVRSGYRCPLCFSRRDDCRCREGNIHISCMRGLPRGTKTDFSPVSGCLPLAPTHLDSKSPLHSIGCCLSPQLLPPILPLRLHLQVISLPASQLWSRLRYPPRPPTVEVAPPTGQGLPHLCHHLCLGFSLSLSHCSPSHLILERTAPYCTPSSSRCNGLWPPASGLSRECWGRRYKRAGTGRRGTLPKKSKRKHPWMHVSLAWDVLLEQLITHPHVRQACRHPWHASQPSALLKALSLWYSHLSFNGPDHRITDTKQQIRLPIAFSPQPGEVPSSSSRSASCLGPKSRGRALSLLLGLLRFQSSAGGSMDVRVGGIVTSANL